MIEPGLLRIAANFVRSFVKATGAEHSESAELRNEYRDIKREPQMKGIAVGILLLALAGTGTVMAQNRNWRSHGSSDWRRADYGRHNNDRNWQRGDYVRHDQYRGCRERRDIHSDIRRDERELEHDRWELRQFEREGNYRAAEREREEMRERYRDIQRDRQVARRDRYNRVWDWTRYTGFGWR